MLWRRPEDWDNALITVNGTCSQEIYVTWHLTRLLPPISRQGF